MNDKEILELKKQREKLVDELTKTLQGYDAIIIMQILALSLRKYVNEIWAKTMPEPKFAEDLIQWLDDVVWSIDKTLDEKSPNNYH